MFIVEVLGIIGAIALTFAALPQAIKSIQEGNAEGVAHGTVLLWVIGENVMLAYIICKYREDYQLLANYSLNAILTIIIARYKYLPK